MKVDVLVVAGQGAIVHLPEGPMSITETHFSAMKTAAEQIAGETDATNIACVLANWFAIGAAEMVNAIKNMEA